jgi:hypothetical protein
MDFRRMAAPTLMASLVTIATTLAACAPPEQVEAKGYTTAKLDKAVPTAAFDGADPDAAQAALGGDRLTINRWEDYVDGTNDGGLLTLHVSGLDGEDPVAGVSIVFVESAGDDGKDVETRLRNASRLEVKFNNGSGIVSTHVFASGTTDAAHKNDSASNTLIRRIFSDSEAILQAPPQQVDGDEQARLCLASYHATVSNAARCVDDPANKAECDAVRANAVATADACQGTKTAKILASGRIKTQNLSQIFGLFSSLGSGGILSKLGGAGGAGGLGGFGNILGGLLNGGAGGLGGLGGAGGGLGMILKLLPSLFGNKGGLTASPLTGLISLIGRK